MSRTPPIRRDDGVAQRMVASVLKQSTSENWRDLMQFVVNEDNPDLQDSVYEEVASAVRDLTRPPEVVSLACAVHDTHMGVDGRTMVKVVGSNRDQWATEVPPGLAATLKVGDQVGVEVGLGGAKIRYRIGPYPPSAKLRVCRILDADHLVVEDHGSHEPILLIADALKGNPGLGPGAEVEAAPEVGLALRLVAGKKEKDALQLLESIPRGLTFDKDLGGQRLAKQELRALLRQFLSSSDLLRAYGLAPQQQVIFSGPPGTGKTYAALVFASEVLGSGLSVALRCVKGPELLSVWQGESEAALRRLLCDELPALARTHDRCILLLDEFETLLRSRAGAGSLADTTGTLGNMVATLLALLDGLLKPGGAGADDGMDHRILLCGCTNRADILDQAVTRSGRFDVAIRFGTLKTEEDVRQVAAIHLRNRLMHRNCSLEEAACQLATYAFTGGPDRAGLPVAAIRQHDGRTWQVRSSDILTGANVKDAVEKAAKRRWYLEAEGLGEPGLTVADLQAGLRDVLRSVQLTRSNVQDFLDLPADVAASIVEVARVGVQTRYQGWGREG